VEAAVRLVTDTITMIGADPLFIEPGEHDSLLAAVRHLPAITSAALLELTAMSNSWKEMATMASPSYAVATSFPTTNAAALAMMLHHNRDTLRHWLRALQAQLLVLEQAIQDDPEVLEARLATLLEAQARWKEAEHLNPDMPSYTDSLREADETRGLGRLFGFGRKRSG
jgi:prephenate dehydrogenase